MRDRKDIQYWCMPSTCTREFLHIHTCKVTNGETASLLRNYVLKKGRRRFLCLFCSLSERRQYNKEQVQRNLDVLCFFACGLISKRPKRGKQWGKICSDHGHIVSPWSSLNLCTKNSRDAGPQTYSLHKWVKFDPQRVR